MLNLFIYVSLLGLVNIAQCDLELRLLKNIDEVYTPISLAIVERVGTNFSLICELISNGSNEYDDQISWGRNTSSFSFESTSDLEIMAMKKSRELYAILKQSETNKATKYFYRLQIDDGGLYFCASFKYMLFKIIHVNVSNVKAKKGYTNNRQKPSFRENWYCNGNMFMCQSNGLCINRRYVCDGKRDCNDGSDESYANCQGNPCKDKISCDDRCIPREWCCDKHLDAECTVTFRPSCCQANADPYNDYEYVPYDLTQIKSNGTRYLFIFLCILATFFSVVLMLLILSKLLIISKKSSASAPVIGQANNLFILRESAYSTSNRCHNNNRVDYRDVDYRARQSFIVGNNSLLRSNVFDPLLLTSNRLARDDDDEDDRSQSAVDNPPSYTEVVNDIDGGGCCEPPPPYTSMEFLENA